MSKGKYQVEEVLSEFNVHTKGASTPSQDGLDGCRIILGLNKDVVDALIISQTSQAVHAKLIHKVDHKVIFCTFICAGNNPKERRYLWNDLGLHKNVVRGMSWLLLGDFKIALNIKDSLKISSSMTSAMCDFKDGVKHIEVMDINSSGLQYTWNQKSRGKGGTLKKLDRVMGNIEFVDTFLGAYAIFQPCRISDQSPTMLKIPTLDQIHGCSMFQVVQKMRLIKNPLRKLLHDHGNLHERVNRLRFELDAIQIAIDKDPYNEVLWDEEAVYLQAFYKAKIDEERNQRSRIEVIMNANNGEFTGSFLLIVFVEHHDAFLGTQMPCNDLNTIGLFTKQVSIESSLNMVRLIINEEIKRAMFDTRDDKALGLNGYTLVFFKKGWDIVGSNVCNAVGDFFGNGKLLKEINHTFLALILKVPTPTKVNDYRPISCCNVIYKCISKIITNRIIKGIKEVVSENQSAFVLGR
nr:hypothetical protein [Tanacetum cinerariifolium]